MPELPDVAVPAVSVPGRAVTVAPTTAVIPSAWVTLPEIVPGDPSDAFIVVGVPTLTVLPDRTVVP